MDVVEVTLTISVPVDAEYSPAEHVDDIVSNARWLFSAADVKIIDVRSMKEREAEPSQNDR